MLFPGVATVPVLVLVPVPVVLLLEMEEDQYCLFPPNASVCTRACCAEGTKGLADVLC